MEDNKDSGDLYVDTLKGLLIDKAKELKTTQKELKTTQKKLTKVEDKYIEMRQ